MNLKHLLGRTGGLITAFALLVSMVVPVSVAGAFYVAKPNITVTCYNCSAPYTQSCSEGRVHYHVLRRQLLTPVSVESVYGVHDIDGMTTLYQVGNEYWLFDMPSSSSDSCVGYCPYKIKDVLTAEGLIDSTKSVDPTTGSASVPVNVTREAATFSVVVPTTLPISVDADGNVTTATDAAIINNSGATVAVKSVEVIGQNKWEIAPYDKVTVRSLPVNTMNFGLQMELGGIASATSINGPSEILAYNSNIDIDRQQKLTITYDALIPAQEKGILNTQIANVVYTIAWGQ